MWESQSYDKIGFPEKRHLPDKQCGDWLLATTDVATSTCGTALLLP